MGKQPNVRILPVKTENPNLLTNKKNSTIPSELKGKILVDLPMPYLSPVSRVDKKAVSFWETKKRLDREDQYLENLRVQNNLPFATSLQTGKYTNVITPPKPTEYGTNILPGSTPPPPPPPPRVPRTPTVSGSAVAFLDAMRTPTVVSEKSIQTEGTSVTSTYSQTKKEKRPVMISTGSDAFDAGQKATDLPLQQIINNHNYQILNDNTKHELQQYFDQRVNHNTVNSLNGILANPGSPSGYSGGNFDPMDVELVTSPPKLTFPEKLLVKYEPAHPQSIEASALRYGAQRTRSSLQHKRNRVTASQSPLQKLRNAAQHTRSQLQRYRNMAQSTRSEEQRLRNLATSSRSDEQRLRNLAQSTRSDEQRLRNLAQASRSPVQQLRNQAQVSRSPLQELRNKAQASRNKGKGRVG